MLLIDEGVSVIASRSRELGIGRAFLGLKLAAGYWSRWRSEKFLENHDRPADTQEGFPH